jgi:thiamine biosynthesis lipoprotein
VAERRTEHIMGTAVTIEVRDAHVPNVALEAAFARLRWVDALFSTYRADSEISALNAGRLALRDAHPAVRAVLARGEALRLATRGAFDMGAPRPGEIEPSGLVKGWAVDLAVARLRRAGVRALCIEAGGDIRVAGGPWRIGIRHPHRHDRVAGVLVLHAGAVATSGAYERGAHIVDPVTGHAARGLHSATVVARTLAHADAYATAIFAMGRRGPAWASRLAAMSILDDDQVLVTPAFVALRADQDWERSSLRNRCTSVSSTAGLGLASSARSLSTTSSSHRWVCRSR